MSLRRRTAVVVLASALVLGAATALVVARVSGFDLRSEQETAALFPLTVHRTGGLAGVDDRALVSRDGTVRLLTRKGREAACRVDENVIEKLADEADDATRGAQTQQGDIVDDFHYSLESHGRWKFCREAPAVVRQVLDRNPATCG